MTDTDRAKRVRLSPAQLAALRAAHRGTLIRREVFPYRHYIEDTRITVPTATVAALWRLGLLQLGERDRFHTVVLPSESGETVLHQWDQRPPSAVAV